MIHDTQSAQISQKQDEHNIYVIMKTMCPPGYQHNGFVATHALGHMMYGYPIRFIDRCIKNLLNKLHVPKVIELTAVKKESMCHTFGNNHLKFEIEISAAFRKMLLF